MVCDGGDRAARLLAQSSWATNALDLALGETLAFAAGWCVLGCTQRGCAELLVAAHLRLAHLAHDRDEQPLRRRRLARAVRLGRARCPGSYRHLQAELHLELCRAEGGATMPAAFDQLLADWAQQWRRAALVVELSHMRANLLMDSGHVEQAADELRGGYEIGSPQQGTDRRVADQLHSNLHWQSRVALVAGNIEAADQALAEAMEVVAPRARQMLSEQQVLGQIAAIRGQLPLAQEVTLRLGEVVREAELHSLHQTIQTDLDRLGIELLAPLLP